MKTHTKISPLALSWTMLISFMFLGSSFAFSLGGIKAENVAHSLTLVAVTFATRDATISKDLNVVAEPERAALLAAHQYESAAKVKAAFDDMRKLMQQAQDAEAHARKFKSIGLAIMGISMLVLGWSIISAMTLLRRMEKAGA
ncbi:hypothetical protein [Paraburkholderia sp. SIMBA_054]|uniref:hypothetical protein n=1 Tax=Paraburkholderia sp. SIMBA_054 TaxID=3085795 RepID=UPI00397A106E